MTSTYFFHSFTSRILLVSLTCLITFSCKSSDPTPDEPDVAETVYIGNSNGYLYAFDAMSGTKKWETGTGFPYNSGPTVANGIVYIGGGAYIYAIDATTGAKKWNAKIGDEDQLGSVNFIPTVVNGIVYASVGGFINKLYALDALTGVKKWEFATGGFDITGPTVINGIAYIGITGKLFAVDALTGAKKWEVVDLQGRPANPSVVDGVIYTNCGTKLYAHDAISGVQKWVSDAAGTGCLTVENGLIFLKGRGLYVINATTGKYVREYDFIWEGYSNPIAVNGVVYVGSGGVITGEGTSTFHAVDALTATKKWTQKVEFATETSPTVATGTVFVGTQGVSSKIYAMDALTGAIKWAVSPSIYANNYTPACVITKKGVVYHASDSGDQQ